MRYIVEKGSITIDGISLTVARIEKNSFAVSIIQLNSLETILSVKKVGMQVNLENVIFGKYIEKFVNASSGITNEILYVNGF